MVDLELILADVTIAGRASYAEEVARASHTTDDDWQSKPGVRARVNPGGDSARATHRLRAVDVDILVSAVETKRGADLTRRKLDSIGQRGVKAANDIVPVAVRRIPGHNTIRRRNTAALAGCGWSECAGQCKNDRKPDGVSKFHGGANVDFCEISRTLSSYFAKLLERVDFDPTDTYTAA